MIRIRSASAVAALALAVTGCGTTTVAGAPSAEGSSVASAEAAARDAAGGSGPPFDACALVPAADVETLIGANDGGKAAEPVGDGGLCAWENPDNYYSVTVDVGATNTATNGLPPVDPQVESAEPVADGMRSVGGGQVQFEAKARFCTVQIATNDTTDGGDTAAATTLAEAVRSRI